MKNAINSMAAALSFAAIALLTLPLSNALADYPERRLTAIVPFAAGSSTDMMARRISPPLAKALGQQVIIENKPGAAGRIGVVALTKSPADGYTILFSGQAMSLIPAMHRNVPWDPARDIQPVAELGKSAYVVGVNSTVPAKDLRDFVKLAKTFPGKLNGSAGGNGTRMAIALFRIKTGTRMETIPFKGTGLAALAVASGEVDFAIMDASAWVSLIPTGRVRVLAVSGEKRLAALPDVPTTAEGGLPDYQAGTMFGVYTKRGAPMDAVQRLNAEINKITAAPEVAKSLDAVGLDLDPKSVEEFTRQYLSDLAKWKDVVARAKIPMTD